MAQKKRTQVKRGGAPVSKDQGREIWFLLAAIFAAVALLFGVIAIAFGISTLAMRPSADPIDAALQLLYFILFLLLFGCFAVASVPFFYIGVFRIEQGKRRRLGKALFFAEFALFLADVLLLVVTYLTM